MKRGSSCGRISACLVALSMGCTTFGPQASVRPIDPGLMVGKVAEPSSFERGDDPLAPEDPNEIEKRQRARTISFWTGIALLSVGGAGMIASGTTGEIMDRRLDKGYEDGTLTRSNEQRYTDIGEAANVGTLVTGVVALVGLAMASLVYGIDYTKCGKLARRRRKNCRPRL